MENEDLIDQEMYVLHVEDDNSVWRGWQACLGVREPRNCATGVFETRRDAENYAAIRMKPGDRPCRIAKVILRMPKLGAGFLP